MFSMHETNERGKRPAVDSALAFLLDGYPTMKQARERALAALANAGISESDLREPEPAPHPLEDWAAEQAAAARAANGGSSAAEDSEHSGSGEDDDDHAVKRPRRRASKVATKDSSRPGSSNDGGSASDSGSTNDCSPTANVDGAAFSSGSAASASKSRMAG